MARWDDDDWAALVDGRRCPICINGSPANVIADIGCCWLTMGADAAPALPGTCALFVRRHVVEVHELRVEEARDFIVAVQRVSKLLWELTGATKINLELHGNTIPHLHMHFYPRYRGDPFERTPINPQQSGTTADYVKHLAVRQRMIDRLAA